MPRASTATKRQQGAANQRDTRHESGLVGPGKRVQKQKSNGHLNGHAKSTDSTSSTPPLPATPPATNGNARQPLADNTMDPKMAVEALRRTSVGGYSESSSSESYNAMPAIPAFHENHRRIDVNASKNPAVHRDSGPLGLAFTVLRSCPLYDTIAILIVLLWIPPTFLTFIHVLFATLTFVPPSLSTGSGISFSEIFEGTLGTPSIATIVVVDVIVLLVWLFLWTPAQDIALDLAQTVIALTLGGGTSGREAGMKNVLVCFGIIGISHYTRNGSSQQSSLRSIISHSTGFLGSPDPDDPLEPGRSNKKGAHGWIRSILAIHILSQGAVRYIRDWYVRREKRDATASIGDPEAAKGTPDTGHETSNTQTHENDSSTSIALNSNLPSTKKKRKQSAQVRMRQPLWAALASTKIVMVKEYETSHAAAESAGTNAIDKNDLGNAPFNSEADRIWITYVGHDEIHFATSFFPNHTPENSEINSLDSPGIDKSKPFYVRVNKTQWQPTRVNVTTDPDQPAGQETRWTGEIFGLAAMSNYECKFVSTVDGSVLFTTSVRTLQPPTDHIVGLPPNAQVSGRPGSPTTTLRTSIATSEIKLAEERNRQKRERKEQRAKQNSVRKELDKLNSNISSSGGNDDKLRQKIQQSNLHMKQAEDAFVVLDSQIASLDALPLDDDSEFKSVKSAFQSQRDKLKQQRADFNAAKQAADHEIQTLRNEVQSMQQKRERMEARIVKLNGEHERITDANARGIDEAQRKAAESERRIADRAQMEKMMTEKLAEHHAKSNEYAVAIQTGASLIQQLQQQLHDQEYYQASSPSSSVPQLGFGVSDIPEGNVPANYPWNPAPNTAFYAPSLHGTSMMASPSPQGVSLQAMYKRGRSSSMHSNFSSFTQSSGEGPAKAGFQKWTQVDKPQRLGDNDRKDSSGSGSGLTSGSGSGPGSVGDPKSPSGEKAGVKLWGSSGGFEP